VPDLIEIIKWIPSAGSAGAVILVVYIFLKYMRDNTTDFKTEIKDTRDVFRVELKEQRDTFNTQLVEHRNYFGDKLKEVTAEFREQYDKTQAQVNRINADTVEALNGLKGAVDSLRDKVK
jgi:glutaredoxin 2